jgi:hypothetical protein
MTLVAACRWVVALGCAFGVVCSAGRDPVSLAPVAEVRGKIVRVQVTPQHGTPTLEVEQSGRTVKVVLGPLRFLMAHDFNPKAGARVEVTGYRTSDGIEASRVTLPDTKQTLRLRDDQRRPLWESSKE